MEKYGVVRSDEPDLEEVAKHGGHSTESWKDIDQMREELKKNGVEISELKNIS